MSYKAIIVKIKTRPHPNADRLQIAEAAGYTCIISLAHEDGELGIVFPAGGQLSQGFCLANRLYRKDPATGEAMGGYLEPSGRIQALKLRKVESDALWLPISALYVFSGKVCDLSEGTELDDFGGLVVCSKYYTPATIKAMRSKNPTVRKTSRKARALKRHYNTPQLRHEALPADSTIIITEKLHGTSGRTGFVMVDRELSWASKLINRLPGIDIKPGTDFTLVSGTRNCIVDTDAAGEKAKGFRLMVHEMFQDQLMAGEEVFYEIVGFEDTGASIMGTHPIGKIGDSKIEKRLKREADDDAITYHYGCVPYGLMPEDNGIGKVRFKVYIYRITHNERELEWEDVLHRMFSLISGMPSNYAKFISIVPTLRVYQEGFWAEDEVREACDELSRGPSTLGIPLREGVCVRAEANVYGHIVVSKSLKHKSWLFCALEGIRKNDPDYVDTEEVN